MSYQYSNRHSESILKIMMGEGDDGCVGDSRLTSTQPASGLPSPALSREEDSTSTMDMDAFWADLGVEAPAPSQNQARSFTSTEVEGQDDWDL